MDKEVEPTQLGKYLRELRERAGMSLRDVSKRSGVSDPFISQVETGKRNPGPEIIQRLAAAYGVRTRSLMEIAGYLEDVEPDALEEPEEVLVDRSYQYVLSDPRFQFGTRPRGELNMEAKRFIVEMYENFTGKRLL